MALELGSTHLISDANLQAYYKLEDVNDSTANARNLTNNGTTPFNAAKFNNGADFGSGNTTKFLTTTNKLGIDGGAISISFWIKIPTEITTSLWGLIAHNSNVTQTRTDIDYQYNGGTIGLLIGRTRLGVANDRTIYNGSLSDGTFHHIVYSYDGSNYKVYIDNVDKGGGASTGNGNINGTDGFTIGESTDGTIVTASAIIDDVGVFNRALTASDVSLLFLGYSASISPSSSASPSASISPSSSVSPSPSAGYTDYSRGHYAALPTNDNDLLTVYSAQDIIDVGTSNNVRVGQTGALEYMVHEYKNFVGTASFATLHWEGQTDLAPSSSTVYLQIYNRNTTTWDNVASDNTSSPGTDFVIEGTLTDLTNYKDASNVIASRVYQQAI